MNYELNLTAKPLNFDLKGGAAVKADKNTEQVLSELEKHGFEAYMVGGCVRDTIMGREYNDIDITTNARPDEMIEVFRGYKVIPTGIKHGTVTVLCGGTPYEITTYRIDGKYTDHRGLWPDITYEQFDYDCTRVSFGTRISDTSFTVDLDMNR